MEGEEEKLDVLHTFDMCAGWFTTAAYSVSTPILRCPSGKFLLWTCRTRNKTGTVYCSSTITMDSRDYHVSSSPYYGFIDTDHLRNSDYRNHNIHIRILHYNIKFANINVQLTFISCIVPFINVRYRTYAASRPRYLTMFFTFDAHVRDRET